MSTTEPWTVCSSFTDSRLRILASEIVRAREEVLREYRPEKGDDAWCLGCRAYRWTCHALAGLANSGMHSWLRAREHGLSFTILIDGEPIRFFCGEPEHPTPRSLQRGVRDLFAQENLAFYEQELGDSSPGWFWLLAIETDDSGYPIRVVLLQANGAGEVRYQWDIPLEASIPAIADLSIERAEPVVPPPPRVRPREAVMKRAAGSATGSDDDDEGS